MPCGDSPSMEEFYRNEEKMKIVSLLCEACNIIVANQIQDRMSYGLREWYDEHHKQDVEEGRE